MDNAGVSTEQLDLFLAPFSAVDKIAPGGRLDDEHENIEVVEMSCVDLLAIMNDGRLLDLKTLTLALTLRLRHPSLFD